jgi:hypothetical protein
MQYQILAESEYTKQRNVRLIVCAHPVMSTFVGMTGWAPVHVSTISRPDILFGERL